MTKVDSSRFFPARFRQNLAADGPAAFVVFLVALPLCLGIAIASGAPPISGLIAGIIGGVVVGILSGSELSISGPAAGLTVIVAEAIATLGMEVFLCAVLLAGCLQIALSVLRAGRFSKFAPHAVIEGMLAAIGAVILLKQIPHAFGWDYSPEGDFRFHAPGTENTFEAIVLSIRSMAPVAMCISFVSLGGLLAWERLRPARFRHVPAPLVAVLTGVVVHQIFALLGMGLPSQHLVSLPDGAQDFFSQLPRPKYDALLDPRILPAALTLAVVASIESLLSVEAIDKFDPLKRTSSPNRELFAQGVGNIASAVCGGLPVTAVIVRGSANVYAGGRTRQAAILHGLFLLVFVSALPDVLNLIPLAALAAVLMRIGYQLAHPVLFRKMWRGGVDEFLPFIVTVFGAIFTDLLMGVFIGVSMVLLLRAGRRSQLSRS